MTKRALLLDRDGVINVDRDYVYRREDFDWQPGIFDLARAAVAQGYVLVVVTNQSGIGRGYYSEADFQALTAWMCARFRTEGAPIAAVYHCPYHPEAMTPDLRVADHPWRKPRPGMLLAARDDLGLDLATSIMIGDRISDMEAAAAAGVGTRILVGKAALAAPGSASLGFAAIVDVAAWMARGRVSGQRG